MADIAHRRWTNGTQAKTAHEQKNQLQATVEFSALNLLVYSRADDGSSDWLVLWDSRP